MRARVRLREESDSDNIPVFFSLCGGIRFAISFPLLLDKNGSRERAIDRKRERPADDSNARATFLAPRDVDDDADL
jgi:hypothetical protein